MLTDVFLYGDLGKKYGSKHCFDINSPRQAISALCANFKDFNKDFIKYEYKVKIGDSFISEQELVFNFDNKKTIKFIPIIQGNKRSGTVKAIAGIAILTAATMGAASVYGPFLPGTSGFSATAFSAFGANVSYGTLALTGLAITLQGFSSLLTPLPKSNYDSRESVDQRASFLFNGATNRSAEGATIPVVYGRFRVGSIVISSGLRIEQI